LFGLEFQFADFGGLQDGHYDMSSGVEAHSYFILEPVAAARTAMIPSLSPLSPGIQNISDFMDCPLAANEQLEDSVQE